MKKGKGRGILICHLLRQGYGGQEGYGGQVGDLRLEMGEKRGHEEGANTE
jgi:hypothetical protein